MSRRSQKNAIATESAPSGLRGLVAVSPKSRTGRLLIVLLGIIAGQLILFGPALVGEKVLLPLDILSLPEVYLPKSPEVDKMVPHDRALSDLVLQFEPERRFTAAEIHHGRLPMWTTYQYAGSPLVWPKFSPFILLECLTLSPAMLPWVQLLTAMTSGLGFYLFCRRALGVGYWAALIPAWCYPMTGFFVFWQGFPTCGAVFWFPWLLLAVDQTIRKRSCLALIGLSLVTCLTLISGHVDVAGQALLASGLYAIWCFCNSYGKQWYQKEPQFAFVMLAAGWSLGFLLASPHLLPMLEYAQTGARIEHRSSGDEERPPAGISELPLTVLPDLYGVSAGNKRLAPGNQIESAAAIYTGVLATLFVAPLAWFNRRRRSFFLFCSALIFLGLSWSLNVPGMVDLLRLPGLRMMSHNRLVFVASLAILALTSVGLDELIRGELSRRRWFLLPATLLAILAAWCFFRVGHLPELVAASQQWAIQFWFIRTYLISGILCAFGVAGWILLSTDHGLRPWFVPAVGILLIGDLLWFAYGRSTQADPALYYPRIPALEQIAQSSTGSRIIGYNCLPAALAQTHELRDVRGYDSVDPGRITTLLYLAADPDFKPDTQRYAVTQWLRPRIEFSQDGIKLSPVLDMLGVRYVIFRGKPDGPSRPAFQSNDYWALQNQGALPRAFVPRRVETVTDESARLEKLGSAQFDPHAVAYVESPVSLADDCRGQVEISDEQPTRISVSMKMETPGLVVLADLWDKGWRAYLNGQQVPILRTNHAVRGVIVPAGTGTLEFRYESASFALGLKLAILAAVILLACLVYIVASRGRVEEL